MEQKWTPWFVNGEEPARDGVYQQMCGFKKELGYQKFENGSWYSWCKTAEEAAKSTDSIGKSRDKWRGLAYDPIAAMASQS